MSTKRKQPLVEALGDGYINEFFRGALFVRDKKVHQIRACSGTRLNVHTLDSTSEDPAWVNENLPTSTLNSFSDIKWPKLGYRNLPNPSIGNVVTCISSARSVQRGLKTDHLSYEMLPINEIFDQVSAFGNNTTRVLCIFFPAWYKFKEGMNKIAAREIPAFALNEDVAIGLSIDQGADRYCDIFYRGKVVGMVKENLEIIVANKTLKRGNLKHLYNLLEN